MSVITISRQLGSYGCAIAQLAAQQLGYQVAWREVINAAARRAGEPEVALATIDELNLFGLRPTQAARHAYHQAVRQVMEELAERGNFVVIGRAGQVILHNRPDVLHVRLVAPVELRAERLAFRKKIPLEAARAQIAASDQARKRYVRRYYHVDWDDPRLYDLVINTERVSIQQAADLVCQAVKFNLQPIPAGAVESDIECE